MSPIKIASGQEGVANTKLDDQWIVRGTGGHNVAGGEHRGGRTPNRRSKGIAEGTGRRKKCRWGGGCKCTKQVMKGAGRRWGAINGSSRAQGTRRVPTGNLGCEDTNLWDTRVQQSTDCEGRMLQ